MRMIGSIPDEQQARRFGDYLLAQQIPQTIEPDAQNGWAIWVHNDDDLDRARQELEAFQRSPNAPKYDGASKVAAQVRAEEEKKQKRLRKNYVDVRTNWARGGAYPVTIALIVVCAIVFGMMLLDARSELVFRWLMFVPIDIAADGRVVGAGGWNDIFRGQVWRLVTPIFIHFGILHFIFNMFWLRDLGGMLENRRGSLWLAIFVLVCAVISNSAQYWWTGYPIFGGMSGVVYGLFGYVWMKSRFEPHLGIHIHPQSVMILMIWLFLAMTPLLGKSIANAAHVGGLLVGLVWGYGPIAYHRWRRKLRQ